MTAESTGDLDAKPPATIAVWAGRVMSAVFVGFMLMSGGMILLIAPQEGEGLQQMGYPEGAGFGIAIALLISTIAYAIPKTSVLGAILLTGYLGGAVATHIRAGEGWGSTVPAFVIGYCVWGALLLRDRRLRELLPLTKG